MAKSNYSGLKHSELEDFPSLVIVTLGHNFGYDGAITTGLEYAQGSWISIMDGDQQDPPEGLFRNL
jgi:glycosyltransferase involved in cell wall biosynthesis